jgi:glycerophosphoryl diester phosphodiesterase
MVLATFDPFDRSARKRIDLRIEGSCHHPEMFRRLKPIVTAAIVGSSLLLAFDSSARAAACVNIPAIAHRGGSEVHAENTLRAFHHARGLGVTTWETDVRFTSDGERVLMHDPTLDATTNGTGEVAAITAATLRANVRTGDGQVVPTLRELMVLAYASQARVLVELKTDPTPAQWAAVAADLDAYGMRGNVTLMSFDAAVALEANTAVPGARTGLVAMAGYVPVGQLAPYDAYIKHQDSMTAGRLDEWSGPLDVYAWTVNAADGWARMHWYDTEPGRLDGVITDRPGAYLAWQRGRVC